jgi:hypothetical protein
LPGLSSPYQKETSMADVALIEACPFCGGEDVAVYAFTTGDPADVASHRYIVTCKSEACLAAGPARDTVEDAQHAWSQRARSSPTLL